MKKVPPPPFSVNCFCESQSSHMAITKPQAPTVASVGLGALGPVTQTSHTMWLPRVQAAGSALCLAPHFLTGAQ